MGVCGDDDFDAAIFAHAEVDILEVEAVGIGIALHGHAVLGAGGQDFFHVVVETLAAEEQASGGMGDDLRVGIFHGGEDSFGHGGAI